MAQLYFDVMPADVRRECLKYLPRARIFPENEAFKHKQGTDYILTLSAFSECVNESFWKFLYNSECSTTPPPLNHSYYIRYMEFMEVMEAHASRLLRHAIDRNYDICALNVMNNSQGLLLLNYENTFFKAVLSNHIKIVTVLLSNGQVPLDILDSARCELVNSCKNIDKLMTYDNMITLLESYGLKFFQITYHDNDFTYPCLASISLENSFNNRDVKTMDDIITFLEKHNVIADKLKFLFCLIRCNAATVTVTNYTIKHSLQVTSELFQYTLQYCYSRYGILEKFISLGYKITKEDVKFVFQMQQRNYTLFNLVLDTYTNQMKC